MLSKMFTKKSPDRKKKRMMKKVLILSTCAAGCLLLTGLGLYGLIVVKLHQPNYVSPLASIEFAHASQNDKVGQLTDGLKKNNIEYSSVHLEKDNAIVVKLKEGGVVTFSSQKDIILQIASLQYILSHLTMEGKLFTRLDLRFEKPVIVLKK